MLINSQALHYHCSIKPYIKPIKKQYFLKCWLLQAIADHDATHFGCLHDLNLWLTNISQIVLVMCIYFFTRVQNTTEVDATCSIPPDPVVAIAT